MKHTFIVSGAEVTLTFKRIKDNREIDLKFRVAKVNWFKIEGAIECWTDSSNYSVVENCSGVALCSRKDKFDWKRGRRESLTNALSGTGWTKEQRAELWRQVIALPEKEWRR